MLDALERNVTCWNNLITGHVLHTLWGTTAWLLVLFLFSVAFGLGNLFYFDETMATVRPAAIDGIICLRVELLLELAQGFDLVHVVSIREASTALAAWKAFELI